MKPLEGILVVDFTIYFAGPSAGKILSDWGANVIKVEPLEGDPARSAGAVMGLRTDSGANPYWEMLNGGKRAISINMKSIKGQQIMERLLARANIFISNCRLNALKRLKLDYEELHCKFPHLIWGHISGYGNNGDDADKPGFDAAAYWSRPGALLDIADKEGYPVTNPFAMGDIATGTTLAGGVAACLYKQAQFGVGERVETSLFATGIWHSACLIQATWHGDDWPKSRRKPFSPICNSYLCKDGQWMYLSIMDYKRYFPRLCSIINRLDLITDERFNSETALRDNSQELTSILDDIFIQQPYNVWDSHLTKADIVHNPIKHFQDIVNDKQAMANHYISFPANRDGSPEIMPSTPIQFSSNYIEHSSAPLLGENTDEIMAYLGYSQNEIENLFSEQIIK